MKLQKKTLIDCVEIKNTKMKCGRMLQKCCKKAKPTFRRKIETACCCLVPLFCFQYFPCSFPLFYRMLPLFAACRVMSLFYLLLPLFVFVAVYRFVAACVPL